MSNVRNGDTVRVVLEGKVTKASGETFIVACANWIAEGAPHVKSVDVIRSATPEGTIGRLDPPSRRGTPSCWIREDNHWVSLHDGSHLHDDVFDYFVEKKLVTFYEPRGNK